MKNSDKPSSKIERRNKLKGSAEYLKALLNVGPEGVVGKGVELGVGALLAKTALRRLPVPLNFVAPYLVEKIIYKHGVENGRDALLTALKWVKKKTD